MSSIISRFSSSMMALFDGSPSEVAIENQTERIRTAMLESLPVFLSATEKRLPLREKLEYAPSIQTLWYLRIDLMTLISAHNGEILAHATLDRITPMFRGLLPDHQMSGTKRAHR